MNNIDIKVCPGCNGSGMIPGTCVCNSEWRGSQSGDDWNDCQCAREQPCPRCKGTGMAENNTGPPSAGK